MAQKPSIPKGTRDFNAGEVAKRSYIMETIKDKFQLFGFQPIETPSFENSETLMGKYGDEGDRLIFKILNSGDFLNKVDYELDKFGDFSSRMTSFVQSLSYEINELIGSSLRSNRELIPLYLSLIHI